MNSGRYTVTLPAASHYANQAMNLKVEKNSDVEVKEHPAPITFTGIKSEHEVSFISLCPLLGKSSLVKGRHF
jgi:hypothetical protein